MQLSIEQKDVNKFLMVGDKVLIKPKNPQSQTKTGLYLPPSVQDSAKIQCGYVIKIGPGFPLPAQSEEHEVWEKKDDTEVRYLPLQAHEGDLAIYLQSAQAAGQRRLTPFPATVLPRRTVFSPLFSREATDISEQFPL